MKKFLGILFLLIVIAVGVCVFFFPGIPYYYKCTHEFELLENTVSELPAGSVLPDDYADYSNLGVRVTAWGDMEAQRTDDKNQGLWENKDGSHFISVYAENLGDNYDFLDRTGISHEALDRYCKAVEKTTPEFPYDFVKLVASITMEDFDIHDSKNAKTFYKMMGLKNDEFCHGADCSADLYIVDGVGYHGYMRTLESASGENDAVINIYPEKNKHRRYIISLSFTDRDDILAIAESVKLTE